MEQTMSKGPVVFATLSLVLILGVAAYAAQAAGDTAHGKEVYTAQKCQMCHSIAGAGNKKSPLDGVGSKLSAEEMKKWIVTPKQMKPDTKMKAYTNIPDKDLSDLVAYLTTLKK
jgi:cytochrome c2